MSRLKLHRSVFTVVGAIGFSALFQNCTPSTHIEAIASTKIMAENSFSGRYCTSMTDDGTRSWKFLFIVDMSRSNIGDWTNERWDLTKATDKDGVRFDQIQQFITGCGASNPKNQYQVMVFSDQAGVPTSSTSLSSLSCTAAFGGATDAETKLATAKAAQAKDLAFWSTYATKPWDWAGQNIFDSGTLFMMDTHYSAALDCASQLLSQDRTSNPTENSNYVVFFLTDGRPYDKADNCESAADKYACYGKEAATATVNMAIDAKVANQSMQMFPIYYGATIPGDKANALTVLNQMALVTGTTGALSVDDINNQAGGQGSFVHALCSLTQVARKIDYRKEVLSVVNLTAKAVGQKLLADSDMDGIPDEIEKNLGYDPANRRTFGVLDSICQQLGGSKVCPASPPACSGQPNNLGVSDCDLAALGIGNGKNLPARQYGIDTDRDGIADLLEILRDTNPTLNDAAQDTDNDGVTNQAEINSATDPLSPGSLPDDRKMIYTESSMSAADFCPTGTEAWQFAIQQLPVIPTLASGAKDSPTATNSRADEAAFDFSHAENENLVLVTYKLVPANAAAAAPQLWGALLRVKVGLSSDSSYRPTYQSLQPSDFYFLGELK